MCNFLEYPKNTAFFQPISDIFFETETDAHKLSNESELSELFTPKLARQISHKSGIVHTIELSIRL